MSPGEVDAFLGAASTTVVAAGPVGGAIQAAVGQLLCTDGRVAFRLWTDDSVANLLAIDDRTCCTVERFPSYYEIAGVMLHGHASPRAAHRGVVTFDLDVRRVVSFDFSKLVSTLPTN
jgi:hypothetical protein